MGALIHEARALEVVLENDLLARVEHSAHVTSVRGARKVVVHLGKGREQEATGPKLEHTALMENPTTKARASGQGLVPATPCPLTLMCVWLCVKGGRGGSGEATQARELVWVQGAGGGHKDLTFFSVSVYFDLNRLRM